MPEKIKEGGDEGGDIGPSGRAEYAIDRFRFGAWLNEFHFGEDLQGAARGIELNRQGDEIKEHDGAPTSDHDHEVGLGLETPEAGEKSKEREPGDDLAGESGGTDRGHAPLEWGVGDFVLDGVATLVRGDAQSGGGVTVIVLGRKNKAAMHGIVVIPEETILLHDLDVTDSGGVEDARGGFRPGEAGGGGNLAPFGVGDFDFGGCPKGEGHRADKGEEKEAVHKMPILNRPPSLRKGGDVIFYLQNLAIRRTPSSIWSMEVA